MISVPSYSFPQIHSQCCDSINTYCYCSQDFKPLMLCELKMSVSASLGYVNPGELFQVLVDAYTTFWGVCGCVCACAKITGRKSICFIEKLKFVLDIWESVTCAPHAAWLFKNNCLTCSAVTFTCNFYFKTEHSVTKTLSIAPITGTSRLERGVTSRATVIETGLLKFSDKT